MDTIAAICSGPGGAIALIRVSGPDAVSIASKAWCGSKALSRDNARRMLLGRIASESHDSESCMAVFMPSPGSYTGEDVIELHCHGGNFAPRRLLDALLRAGARAAEPGEFTKRAFLNGKLDLTQAEAVADLISAKSSLGLRLAERQLSGVLRRTLQRCREKLLDVLAEAESRLDFPEEMLDWQEPQSLIEKLDSVKSGVAKLAETKREGALLRDGLRLVIAGRPNSGKSSLLNLLLGYDRAIVSETPGTTRDTVEEDSCIRGLPVKLIDTAGLRDSTCDPIESLGMGRSKDSLAQASLAIWLLDASADASGELVHMKAHLPPSVPAIAAWNKCDLHKKPDSLPDAGIPTTRISVSMQTGIETFLDLLESAAWGKSGDHHESDSAVNSRQAALLEDALPEISSAASSVRSEQWEIAAASIRRAVSSLAGITGEEASPDVLDEIFSRFCIGK